MLDRRTPPVFNRNFSFELIPPTSLTLPSGLQVFFISGGEQEVIKIEVIYKAGRWYEPASGISYFVANLLTKGTSKRSSYDIASQFDKLGAHIETGSGVDFMSISLYTLSKKLGPALELLVEILREATFPERELEQAKAIYRQNLLVNMEKTSFLASRAIRKNVFGDEHPYGKDIDQDDISNIEAEHLRNFYDSFFREGRVIVSGKIADTASQQILSTLAALHYEIVPEPEHAIPAQSPLKEHLTKPESIQSSIRIGKRSVLRSTPDYPDVLLLNHILGGYFGSRLMKNIREDKGLTYGIHAGLHTMKHNSYLVISTDVNKENRQQAFDEVRKELIRLREELISADEIETARYHFLGSLQAELSTSFAHADKWKNILLYNLSESFYDNLLDRITMMTAEDLQRAASKYFQEDSFFEISVG